MSVSLVSFQGFAQKPAENAGGSLRPSSSTLTSPGTQATSSRGLVSVSYQSLVQCFPDLQSQKLQQNFNLTDLNDWVHEKWALVSSDFKDRQIEFVSASGARQVAKIKFTPRANMAPPPKGMPFIQNSRIELFSVGKDGTRSELRDLSIPKVNPSADEVNQLLLGARVQVDRLLTEDIYSGGKKGLVLSDQKVVRDFVLEDTQAQKKLSCELSSGQAVLCFCKIK